MEWRVESVPGKYQPRYIVTNGSMVLQVRGSDDRGGALLFTYKRDAQDMADMLTNAVAFIENR